MTADSRPPRLAGHIAVHSGYLRATNIERHHDAAEHYIPTGRALDVLRRLIRALTGDAVTHAWSLTGPYGAGKSSFGLYLDTLLGPAGTARDRAEHTLQLTDPALTEQLNAARAQAGDPIRGFLRAATTCQREPAMDSVLRALHAGTTRYWPKSRPRAVTAALREANTRRDARSVAAAFDTLAEHAPVLILLDEFGKTLEHYAGQPAAGADDLFVLQELAERAAAPARHPSLLLTLQHLAYDDYVRGASLAQRREWGKVAGRFEDVAFLETPEQSLRLVAGALHDLPCAQPDPVDGLLQRRSGWAESAAGQLGQLGLTGRLPGGAGLLERCYPLHPVTLLVLPELCAVLGQHGRTLFTFLAGNDRNSLASFLAGAAVPAPDQPLPVLTLPVLYDFFAGPAQTLTTNAGPRWLEIDNRVREAGGLPTEDLACLKAVGLLNLIGQTGGLRASADLLAYALSEPDGGPDPVWRNRLTDLESRGWVTYRGFADEYRIWQGSDVDLRSRVADAREQLRSTSTAALLSQLHAGGPVIAARHTQRVGMLRYFTTSYADANSTTMTAPAADDPADGALIYHLGDAEQPPTLTVDSGGRPVIAVTSQHAGQVTDAAIEAAAALAVLDQHDVWADTVARRELQDRASDARARLTAALQASYGPAAAATSWWRLDGDGPPEPLTVRGGLSRLLSDVCDSAYHASPEIHNEMLGRRELTSQGAKARRNLLEAMITHPTDERLGLLGYKPERAMYEALLRHTGLHQPATDGAWAWANPTDGSLRPAWGTLKQLIDRPAAEPINVRTIYSRLMAPPIGLKEGPIPVLLTALLAQRGDDIAIYQDGTYQPRLTTDLLERLLKAPDRFALKAFDVAGARANVLTALNRAVTDVTGQSPTPRRGGTRNSTVLSTAAPLLAFIRSLPAYTVHARVSGTAAAVRGALSAAREPDELLFRGLPEACGLAPFTAKTRDRADDVKTYAQVLTRTLIELRDSYPAQLDANATLLADALALPSAVGELRRDLRVRVGPLSGHVIDPRMRSFIFTAQDAGLDDRSWLESLALTIGERPPAAWRPDDVTRYQTNLRALLNTFRRLEALHFDVATHADRSGFTARRLTLTAPDGAEGSRVLYLEDTERPAVEAFTAAMLGKARTELGPHAADALLSVLAEQAISEPTETAQPLPDRAVPTRVRSRRHA